MGRGVMMTNEPRETSGATTCLLLRHVRAEGGDAAVRAVLERAGVADAAESLENDMSAWVSYETRIRLFEAATEVLDDPRTMFLVGAGATRHGADHALVLMFRALGSPRHVYRQVPRAASKFTTTSTMELLSLTATTAVLSFRLHDGYEHSRLDCEYAQGLLSEVPRVFGLPAATITHAECQGDGFPACRYEVRWAARGRGLHLRLRRAAAATEVEVRALRGQVQDLQLAASDLVSSDDVGSVLQRLIDRAASALLAPAYLLVAHGRDGGEPVVHTKGLSPTTARDLADMLLRGGDLGPAALVVDVASTRAVHGKLAVLYGSSDRGMEQDRALAQAYARHAAAALDLLTALADSRREASRASALLSLAHALAVAPDASAVAEVVVEAVPGIVGCDSASVMQWDPATGTLSTLATGRTGPEADVVRGLRLESDAIPEMGRLLTEQGPLLLDVDGVSAPLRAVFESIDAHSILVVPMQAGGTLLGVVTGSWQRPVEAEDRREALVRFSGVADQAATAMQNARLLETVRHQSLHDALTGLPNRVLFTRGLDDALRAAPPGVGTAVLFCDLDRFKHVNDRRGHAAGDELLRQSAARLRGVVRPEDGVGRLSGDEFAVRLHDVDEQRAVSVAERIVESLGEPFRIDGQEVRITVTVGVALHVGPDGRGERLLAAADSAMYDAKESGRNQVGVAGMVPGRAGVPSLEAELGRAIADGQMRLFFQPVVDVTSSAEAGVVGAEALLRWAHPRLGLLAPAAFLPLAEESGLVTSLDLWAVRAACAALATWLPEDRAPLRVAVNLASGTLLDPRLLGTVRAALTENGLSPDRLHLELVESRSLVDLPGVIERLVELRRLGVRISLDDFGTGYSTLTWLQALPVDQIKIDRSFIMRLPGDLASVAVVRGVMALARELELEVIAEGVEEPEQLALLRDMGIVMVQGYLLGRPGPVLSMEPLVVVPAAEG